MAKPIKLKRSSVPGKAPETNQLQLGELALNTYDGKLYTKKSANGVDTIVELSGGGGGTGGGGSAGITVGTYGTTAGDVGTEVSAIRFDSDAGFSVVQGPNGTAEARVSLGSTFKTWHVAGQQDLVAEGEDEITIEAGTGVTLTTTPTGTKKLKIDGFSGAYEDLSGTPTLGTAASSATTDFATAAQGALADSALQAEDIGVAVQAYDANLVSDGSYVHTDNNYTTAEKTKLEGIEAGAQVNVQADWNATTGSAEILNKPTLFSGAYADLTGTPDLSTKADLVDGKLSTSQLPDLAISEFLGDVASEAAMLAKTGQRGDWVVRTDTSEAYMLVDDGGALLADWRKIATPVDAVSSVNGQTGAVVLAASDVGAATSAQGSLADSALQPGAIGITVQAFDPSTVFDANYVHTDNNYTSAEKTKLAGIEAGAEVNEVGEAPLDGGSYVRQNGAWVAGGTGGGGAVDSVNGQTGEVVLDADDISTTGTTNQFTTAADIAKLAGIAAGAEVNVNADWAASSGDAQILNKPTLGTAAATDATAYATAAQGLTADSALQPGDNISALLNNAGYITASGVPVLSVAGRTGAVTLSKADVGLSYVDNTSDLNKPVSTATQTALDGKAALSHSHSSYQPIDEDLSAIAALTGFSGILKKTAVNTWTLDSTNYLTGNQNITVSGDASGSGTTSISLTLGNTGVAAGTYNDSSVAVRPFTVDAKGRITSIGSAVTISPGWSSITSKPTTVAGFGITDAAPLASPTFTGTPAAPTAAVDTQTTQIATTAYVVNQGYLKSSTASSTYALVSQIASTASELEAQAGTNNSKMMTPLRVAQAIAALGSGGGGGGGGGGGSSGPTYTDQMFLVSAGVF